MLWLDQSEINSLPNTGSYWTPIVSAANTNPTPHLGWKDATDGSVCLAKAYLYRRNNDAAMRTSGIALLNAAMPTLTENEDGASSSRSIAPSRKVCPYIIAASMLDLGGSDLANFDAWVNTCTTTQFDDNKTILTTHLDKPNNWGTFAGATVCARALYQNDATGLANNIRVFKAWLGDFNQYLSTDRIAFGTSADSGPGGSGFVLWGGLCWQFDQGHPVGINPLGATISGANVDGVLPDDLRRWDGGDGSHCVFQQNPFPSGSQLNYTFTALQGTVVHAGLLAKAGYPSWTWSDNAIKRAFGWIKNQSGTTATGDDVWQYPLVDYYNGTTYWNDIGKPVVQMGKNMSWTDWSHGLRINVAAPKIVFGIRV